MNQTPLYEYKQLLEIFTPEHLEKILNSKGSIVKKVSHNLFTRNANQIDKENIKFRINKLYTFIFKRIRPDDRIKAAVKIAHHFRIAYLHSYIEPKFLALYAFKYNLDFYEKKFSHHKKYYILDVKNIFDKVVKEDPNNEYRFSFKKSFPDRVIKLYNGPSKHELLSSLQNILTNSSVILNRLNFNLETIPQKWVNTKFPRNKKYLFLILKQEFDIQVLEYEKEESIQDLLSKVVNIIKLQTTIFFVHDKMFRQNSKELSKQKSNEEFDFDEINQVIEILQLLTYEISNVKTNQIDIFKSQELKDILFPLTSIPLINYVKANEGLYGFRDNSFQRIRLLRSMLNRENVYFISFKNLKLIFDDFSLYNKHTAKYTNIYIEGQSKEWKIAMGHVDTDQLLIDNHDKKYLL